MMSQKSSLIQGASFVLWALTGDTALCGRYLQPGSILDENPGSLLSGNQQPGLLTS